MRPISRAFLKGLCWLVCSLGRNLGHFLKKWDSNYNNSWEKLQIYGWNIPLYLPPYESEITYNYNTILSHSEFSHLSANKCYHTLAVSSLNCWRERVCECANSSLKSEGSFLVLWGPCGSYPQFDLARFLSHIPVMTYPKIIFLALISEEIGVLSQALFFTGFWTIPTSGFGRFLSLEQNPWV